MPSSLQLLGTVPAMMQGMYKSLIAPILFKTSRLQPHTVSKRKRIITRSSTELPIPKRVKRARFEPQLFTPFPQYQLYTTRKRKRDLEFALDIDRRVRLRLEKPPPAFLQPPPEVSRTPEQWEEMMHEYRGHAPAEDDWPALDSDFGSSEDDEATEEELLASQRRKKKFARSSRYTQAKQAPLQLNVDQRTALDLHQTEQQKTLDMHKAQEANNMFMRNLFSKQYNASPAPAAPQQFKMVKVWDPAVHMFTTVRQRNSHYDSWSRRKAEHKAAASITSSSPQFITSSSRQFTTSPLRTARSVRPTNSPLRFDTVTSSSSLRNLDHEQTPNDAPPPVFGARLPPVAPPNPYTGPLDTRAQLSKYMQDENRRLNPPPPTPLFTEAEADAHLTSLGRISLVDGKKKKKQTPTLTPQQLRHRSHFFKFLRPLPPALDDRVTAALAISSPGTTVATTVTGTELRRSDIASLLSTPSYSRPGDPSGWLNDEVINAFFSNLVSALNARAGHTRGQAAPYAAFSSAWVATVKRGGIQGIKRWARRQGVEGGRVLETECVFFPINTGAHWVLGVVSGRRRRIAHFDSLDGGVPGVFVGSSSIANSTSNTDSSTTVTATAAAASSAAGSKATSTKKTPTSTEPKKTATTLAELDTRSRKSTPTLSLLRQWLAQELGSLYIAAEWTEDDRRSAIQTNGSDCGMFTCLNGLAFALGFENPRGELGGGCADDSGMEDGEGCGEEGEEDGSEGDSSEGNSSEGEGSQRDGKAMDIDAARRGVVAMLVNGGFVGDFALD